MSKYTTEVRFICEAEAGLTQSAGYDSVEDIIQAAIPNIFSFAFPIFDEEYRNVLCTKILKHYYTREIGMETYGLWKLRLDTKLNEIMGYDNKLYESVNFEFNPLYDADYTRTTLGEEHGGNDASKIESGSLGKTGTIGRDGQSINSNTRYDKFSDTPQGSLVNVDNDTYLTSANKITDSGSSNGSDTTTYNTVDSHSRTGSETGKFNTSKDYVEHIVGKFPGKSYSKIITEYRDALINVDMMIIDELGELFMRLW